MRSAILSGSIHRFDSPIWRPLEALLPDVLCARFMWMCGLLLEDGTEVQAFKHADTRRYLHLDGDAVAYEYVGRERYRRIPAADALLDVFDAWWLAEQATAEERASVREAIAACAGTDAASGRDPHPPASRS